MRKGLVRREKGENRRIKKWRNKGEIGNRKEKREKSERERGEGS